MIQLLRDCKKPIIGHNMMYDILFTYEKFIAPLPSTYKEFANAWTKEFKAGTFDTKCLAKHIISGAKEAKDRIFQKTQLQHVFDRCEGSKKDGLNHYNKRISNNLTISFDTISKTRDKDAADF